MSPYARVVPPPKVPPQVASLDFSEEGLLSDLDRAFEQIQIVSEKPARKAAGKTKRKGKRPTTGVAEMQKTYLAVTQVHLRPIVRYLKAVSQGVTSKDVVELVHYVVGPLVGKTRKVGMVEHARALIRLQRSLRKIINASSRRITQEQREELAASFESVSKLFKLEFRGHSTAVVNLLGFYRSVKRTNRFTTMDLKKLFGIGISSLTMIRKSSIAELVSLSGLAPDRISELRKAARTFNLMSLL